MIMIFDLQKALLELLQELDNTDIELIIGGGYGLYLKANYVRGIGVRTLLSEWPEPRSTNDIDLFLRPELLIESSKVKPLAEAFSKLGYNVVTGAEKYQFIKNGPEGNTGSIKIDILTGPQDCFEGTGVRVDERRIRPNPSVGIHAHPVNEAVTLEEGLFSVPITGKPTLGGIHQAEISIPHPYTFLMMKLFAFRDRLNDVDKDFGRYHAMDVYTILATTTEEEWRYALTLRDRLHSLPYVIEAGQIVSNYFLSLDQLGMIRLRESPYYHSGLQLDEFMSSLKDLYLLSQT